MAATAPGIISSYSHNQTAKALFPHLQISGKPLPKALSIILLILLVRFASHAPAQSNTGTRNGIICASINQIHLPGKGPPSDPTEGDHSTLSQEGRMPLGMAVCWQPEGSTLQSWMHQGQFKIMLLGPTAHIRMRMSEALSS